MSTADHREPTNDELWSQPPAPAPQVPAARGGLAPLPPTAPTAQLAPAHPPVVGQAPAGPRPHTDRSALILAIVSLVLAIPLTAISSVMSPGALVLVWVGIVAINFIFSRRR